MEVIICTPAGRQRFLEILQGYIVRDYNRGLLSKWQLWLNTINANDIAWMKLQQKKYPFIELIEPGALGVKGNSTIHQYYPHASDPENIYLRLDDDICYIHEHAIENIVEFRKQNPHYFLILGNVINNAICSHVHQRLGSLPLSRGAVSYNRKCRRGWANGNYAGFVHRCFLDKLENGLERDYFFPRWDLFGFEIVSSNVACWMGKDMVNVQVGVREEQNITRAIPMKLRRRCCISGEALFAHFSYYTQRKALFVTDLVHRYKTIMERLTS